MYHGFSAKTAARRLDACRTAKELTRRHGDAAALVAARWSRCAQRAGDPARAAAWRRVCRLVAPAGEAGD